MELDTVNIERAMAQSHNLPFIACSGDFEAAREIGRAHHPRVVSSHSDALGQSIKNRVDSVLGDYGSNTMEHIAQIL